MDFIGDDIGRIIYGQEALKKDLAECLTIILPDRPVLTATLWLNFQTSELQVEIYKITSLLLHAMNGFLIYLLTLQLVPRFRKSWLLACLPAFAFVVHPLNNQAVNSISQRGVLLSTLFVLLAFYFSNIERTNKDKKFPVWPLAMSVFAILSKSNAVIIPFLLIAADCLIYGDPVRKAIRRNAPLFLIFILPIIFYFVLEINSQSVALPWWQYLIAQSRVIFLYFRLFFIPIDLHFIYQIDSNPNIFANGTWLAILGHLGLISFIVFLFRKQCRVLCFTLFAVYLALLPESSFFSIRHLAFEHRTYMPLAFFALAIAAVFGLSKELWEGSKKQKILVRAICALGGGAVIVLTLLNLRYNSEISTYEKWTFYNLEKTPKDNDFAVFSLGEFLDRKSEAGPELVRRLELHDPDNRVFQIYKRIFSFEKMDRAGREMTLKDVFEILTASQVEIGRENRANLTLFYGRNIQQMYSGIQYWEKVDDLIYTQLPELKKHGDYFHEIYKIYQANLFRLTQFYLQNPPSNISRSVRALLALKYNFDLNDPIVNGKLKEIKAQSQGFSEVQTLIKNYEERGLQILPITRERID